VNVFVHELYQSIKAAKPWVKFGISPFGIWRPGNPPQIKGLDAFEVLHADSRKWLEEGWVDYLAPQLYWSVAAPETSFPVLLRWWAQQNPGGRLICPGLNSYNAGRSWPTEEIVEQIRLARRQSGVSGHIHFDSKALMRNGALDAALQREVYSEAALIPATPWLARSSPPRPELRLRIDRESTILDWTVPNGPPVQAWLLQTQTRGKWTTQVLAGAERSMRFTQARPEVVALTCVDRFGNAGPACVVEQKN
jgi:uncharacterized lipoprotein YddW (UPF0748 family)